MEKGFDLNLPILIAGPCAAESRQQMLDNALAFKEVGGLVFRASGYKPRTTRSWSGMYFESPDRRREFLDGVVEIANMGLIPATEVRNVGMAHDIVETVQREVPRSEVLIWIGSRMQEHLDQDEIGEFASRNPRVYLMFKNQPWRQEKHWDGIASHILGDDKRADRLARRILACHRGFDPGTDGQRDPNEYRNPHDLAMAMRVKHKTGLPMIIDPSHIGGTVANVERVIEETFEFCRRTGQNFDGFIIEARIDPHNALTDATQHLTWDRVSRVISRLVEIKAHREILVA